MVAALFRTLTLLSIVSLALPGRSAGMFMEPVRDVPIARMLENFEHYCRLHPGDHRNRYVWARLQCIAVAQGEVMLEGRLSKDASHPPKLRAGVRIPPQEGGIPQADPLLSACDSGLTSPAANALCQEELQTLVRCLRWGDASAVARASIRLALVGPGIVTRCRALLAAGPVVPRPGDSGVRNTQKLAEGFLKAECLRGAIVNYTEAMQEPAIGYLCRLGRAWCYEVLGRTREAFLDYRQVFEEAYPPERHRGTQLHLEGVWHGSYSLEAGMRILALRHLHGDLWNPVDMEEIEERVDTLTRNHRAHGVTPVIIPLRGDRRLQPLLDDDASIAFDLDGRGRGHRWTWISPRAGLLVWDPRRSGRVGSGRELFGSFTWHVCWKNGYEPLSLLDDDRDGWIAGRELAGLSLWVDANSNGVAETGEVRPVARHRVRRLGYRARSGSRGAWCPAGVEFSNGSFYPSFDWEARPAVNGPRDRTGARTSSNGAHLRSGSAPVAGGPRRTRWR